MYVDYIDLNSCRRLWQSVLLQLCIDCFSTKIVYEETWQYVEDNTEDFRMLCEYSGVDAKKLRAYLLYYKDRVDLTKFIELLLED